MRWYIIGIIICLIAAITFNHYCIDVLSWAAWILMGFIGGLWASEIENNKDGK